MNEKSQSNSSPPVSANKCCPAHEDTSLKDRLAFVISLIAMVLIWLYVNGLLWHALYSWKRDWQHTFVHALAIVTLIALWVLIPVWMFLSFRKKR